MAGHAPRVRSIMMWFLALGAMVGIAIPGRAHGDTRDTADVARSEDSSLRGHGPGLGSSEEPILLEGVEATALRRMELLAPYRLEFGAGAATGSLYGLMGGTGAAGSRIGWTGYEDWGPETNVIAGVGIEVPMGRPESIFLEGGRVTLRDPIDVVASGNAGGEYWATSAGFQICF